MMIYIIYCLFASTLFWVTKKNPIIKPTNLLKINVSHRNSSKSLTSKISAY